MEIKLQSIRYWFLLINVAFVLLTIFAFWAFALTSIFAFPPRTIEAKDVQDYTIAGYNYHFHADYICLSSLVKLL